MTEVRPLNILIVDDDEDDLFFAQRALEKTNLPSDVKTVRDGAQMMDYLCGRGDYRGDDGYMPDIILLDLNMPKKNGKEALAELRADPRLKHIPVILFTTSSNEQDIITGYQLGANSYIRKPVSFDAMVEAMGVIKTYWMELVSLPPKRLPA